MFKNLIIHDQENGKVVNIKITCAFPDIIFFSGNDWVTLKDWTDFENTMKYVSWKNFHNSHKDVLKASLRAQNGALNDIVVDTNGVLIDLTAPVMEYLVDGTVAETDVDFQVSLF